MTHPNSPLAIPVGEAVKLSGIGRTTFYKLLKARDIPARKCGSRTLVIMADLQNFLLSLPEAGGRVR